MDHLPLMGKVHRARDDDQQSQSLVERGLRALQVARQRLPVDQLHRHVRSRHASGHVDADGVAAGDALVLEPREDVTFVLQALEIALRRSPGSRDLERYLATWAVL